MMVCDTCTAQVVKRGNYWFHSPGGFIGTIARKVRETSKDPGRLGSGVSQPGPSFHERKPARKIQTVKVADR